MLARASTKPEVDISLLGQARYTLGYLSLSTRTKLSDSVVSKQTIS